jgi:glucokinase
VTTAIGIDIGATKIAAALVDVNTGEMIKATREPTRPAEGGAAVLVRSAQLARRLADRETTRVGIGICELVDRDGHACSGYAIDWRGLDTAAAFSPLSVTIDSDVRAAALAEAHFGAGRAFDEFLYLSVGSGISHCLVEAGRPRAGWRGNALVVGAPPVEDVASGRALARTAGLARAEEALADPTHERLTQEAATELGVALAALINALDPQAAIIGGGLGLVDSYRERVIYAARKAIFAESTRALAIVPAGLAGDSGVIGAALAATRSGSTICA